MAIAFVTICWLCRQVRQNVGDGGGDSLIPTVGLSVVR